MFPWLIRPTGVEIDLECEVEGGLITGDEVTGVTGVEVKLHCVLVLTVVVDIGPGFEVD